MNATFTVGSLFKCENIEILKFTYEHDPDWRQTALGCYVLELLKEMYHFNVTYTRTESSVAVDYEVPLSNRSVDFYVRPTSMKREFLKDANPINSLFQWRLGFLLRYRSPEIQTFYTMPFSSLVWACLIWTLILSALVFYLLSFWEKRLLGGECCLHHEILFAFSAYCQHILPLQANLSSRRIAYLIFIMSAYVIHCFYTSNLLSHLVNDKDRGMDLEGLAKSEYEFVIIKDMNLITEERIQQVTKDKYLKIVEEKLYKSKIMDVYSALEAVRDTKTAVLTDYITLYPIAKRMFDNHELCQLIEVNLYSNVKNYLFTSKSFPLAEQFKIGTLRLKEAGLLTKLLKCDRLIVSCDNSQEQAGLSIIIAPIAILAASCLLSLFILIGEKIHYEFCHLWPYIE